MPDPNVRILFDGEAQAWIEQESSIHIKVIAACGDPVELTWNQTRELGTMLIQLAEEGERLDGSC